MSAIEKNLADMDIKPKRNEERQVFLRRAAHEATSLPDKDWEALDTATQDWANEAADVINAGGKNVADFPDLKTAEPETTTRRRTTAAKEEPEAAGKTPGTVEITPGKVKLKMAVKVVTKRGKEHTGTVVEIDEEVLVLKMGNGEEEELSIDRIGAIFALDTSGREEAPEADPVKVGAVVTVVTKRGKEVTGKIVELDEEVIVLETDGGDEELARDRVESIKVKGGRAAAAEPETKTTRRGAAKDEPAGDDKKTRSSNPAGVSVGQRIKELIAADPEATIEEIDKALTKEGLEYKETSLKMNYADCHKFLEALRAAKRLKG